VSVPQAPSSSLESTPASADDVIRIPVPRLQQFVATVFGAVGVPAEKAEQAAEALVIADRRGIPSHGVARLPMYLARIESGVIDPSQNLAVVRQTGSTATLDAKNGLGLALASDAMELCMAKAQATGLGMVTVRNSTHFGIAGHYVMQAARQGLGAIALTNAGPSVVPTGGVAPMLGTNPIAFAVPTGLNSPPFVLDMATSAVSFGKVETARRSTTSLTPGLAFDATCEPTVDPHRAKYLVPLGGDRSTGGYKGYGLAVMVDVLCGPLAGALWGTHLSSVQVADNLARLGHTFLAWQIAAFRDPDEFYRDVGQMLNELRGCPTRENGKGGGVLVPGDLELEATRQNDLFGVLLHPSVFAELQDIGRRFGIPFADESTRQ
jgi:LDH2 family malate/lactate/ureidoglycolate dehydrogenase